jgi:hypothetical protein
MMVVVGACGTLPPPNLSIEGPPPADVQLRRSSAHLTASDLAGVGATNTFDAVRRLRPEYLHASPRTAGLYDNSTVAVYIDDLYAGDISALQSIPLDVVREINFAEPAEARTRFGFRCQCGGGAVLVSTYARRR